MFNAKVLLYLNEHRALLKLVIDKMRTQPFLDLQYHQKLLYIEGVQSYRKKVESKIFNPPKKKKAIVITLKIPQLATILDVITFGIAHSGIYEQNIVRTVTHSLDKQCTDYAFHLDKNIIQLQ